MIDISDGLLQDLGHICKASRVGAVVAEEKLPLSRGYRSLTGMTGQATPSLAGKTTNFCFVPGGATAPRIEKLQAACQMFRLTVSAPVSRHATG